MNIYPFFFETRTFIHLNRIQNFTLNTGPRVRTRALHPEKLLLPGRVTSRGVVVAAAHAQQAGLALARARPSKTPRPNPRFKYPPLLHRSIPPFSASSTHGTVRRARTHASQLPRSPRPRGQKWEEATPTLPTRHPTPASLPLHHPASPIENPSSGLRPRPSRPAAAAASARARPARRDGSVQPDRGAARGAQPRPRGAQGR